MPIIQIPIFKRDQKIIKPSLCNIVYVLHVLPCHRFYNKYALWILLLLNVQICGPVVYICSNARFQMQFSVMHFMHLMCLHFTFLFLLMIMMMLLWRDLQVWEKELRSHSKKNVVFYCFAVALFQLNAYFCVILTLKCITTMMINNCLKMFSFFDLFHGM